MQKILGLPVTIKENKKPTTAKTKPKAKINKDKPKKITVVKKQIYKVDLDISPDSKLYKNSVLKLQEENDKNKKELYELLKKKEALKKKKTTLVEERAKKIKEYENKIKLLKLKKKRIN